MTTNAKLHPLEPGDLALRFKTTWYTRRPTEYPRPTTEGMEVVQVLVVEGERVTWTNHKRSRFLRGQAFRHTSNRKELIAVNALLNLSGAGHQCAAS